MAKRICSVDGCDDQHKGYGYCRKHLRRWKKHGDPTLGAAQPPLNLTDEERRERARQRARDWYAANRERALANVRAYKENYPERVRQANRDYYAANRELALQNAKEWAAAHPDRVRATKRKHAIRPEARQRRAEYQAANPEKMREWRAAWAARNPDKIRATARKNVRIRKARKRLVQVIPFTSEQWAAKVAYWGDRCWWCGGNWSEMDHVKPIAAGGADMLCNLRPICKPCNSRKNAQWPIPMARNAS